jgi:hypothetical protein
MNADDPASSPTPPPQRASIGDLFRQLIENIADLVRLELRLARAEFRTGIRQSAGSVAAIAVGGMLAMVATSCLLVATIAWLATKVGLVNAALIVAAVLGVAAAMLIAAGIGKLQQLDLAPKRAAANLKRNVEMLKGD